MFTTIFYGRQVQWPFEMAMKIAITVSLADDLAVNRTGSKRN
jgi:hypothetical protein